ncbi:MAG: DUF1592 domain-containing protein [Planctomycetales bacterium]|nr:DUF1592 domain-containing protein [Planctomycetales bacterium]
MDLGRLTTAVLACLCLRGPALAEAPGAAAAGNSAEFVARFCVECHQGSEAESGLDFADQVTLAKLAEQPAEWRKVAQRVADGEMPPIQSDQPDAASREQFVLFVRGKLHEAACEDGITPGPMPLRRLNRNEFAATIRDLLGIQVDVSQGLPADGAGGEGFDNAAETLFISPLHAEKYLEAAHTALEHALQEPRTRERLLIATPAGDKSPQQAAREVLAAFLPRAFRRAVADAELTEYLELFDVAYQQDESYVEAVRLALEAALVSPHFIFLLERPNAEPTVQPLGDYELAARLSYFLWGSMPDEELFQLAGARKLNDPDVLRGQVERMLAGGEQSGRRGRGANRVRGFAQNFIEQWLGTRALGREFKPDASAVRRYDSELEGGLKYEPVLFFEEILTENRSLLELIDADYTYANRRLAQHYGIKGEFREQPRRVELEAGSHRGGLLSMGAVLAVSSYPHRTSPVLRGKWILETILGTPPPPPPPNVPPLAEKSADGEQPTTLRERLERHRQDIACAGCHSRMDPLGFGLENYDVVGRWRTELDGQPVDARGTLPDGTEFEGPEQLKKLLLSRKELVIQNLTRRMLGYALARQLTAEDDCVIEEIVAELQKSDYKSHTLVMGIVTSVPFRLQAARPESPQP